MPRYNHPPEDIIQVLQRRIEALERALMLTQNRSYIDHPIWDKTDPPVALVDGSIFIGVDQSINYQRYGSIYTLPGFVQV